VDSQLWTDIARAVLTALIAGGAIGGVFWKLLGKGIEARVEKLLDKHRTDLAAQLHLQNTVHSRLDEKRSEAVQALHAGIAAHKWEVVGFNPHTWGLANEADIGWEAMKWWLERQGECQKIMRMSHDLSLLISEQLMQNVAGWGLRAQQTCQDSMLRVMRLREREDYKSADANGRRSLLRAHNELFMQEVGGLRYLDTSEKVLQDLRTTFHATGPLPRVSSLFDPDEVARADERIRQRLVQHEQRAAAPQVGGSPGAGPQANSITSR
jgi:hypothetical protein